ncbi:MAG: ROK family protein [Bacteroidales bacterium]|nr:ROK family protein [Bacteroidales bacterium]
MKYSIGVDMGGTNTDLGLVTENGNIIQRRNIPTNAYTEFEPYIRDLMKVVDEMLEAQHAIDGVVPALEGIGVGAPNGNFYTGCVDNAPNLTMKGVLDFGKEIHKYRDVPVVLSNDANAAAYGEYVYGGARGMKHFIMFTLGTGVGSGIVVDGKLVHGCTGAAGELGHAILYQHGRKCSCGREGCLETYTSARGIVQTYKELKSEVGGMRSENEITSKMIGELAHQGDPVALKTWATVGDQLGLAMANAVTFSAPEAIFLMGGPAQVGEPLLKPLREAFDRYLLNIFAGTCQIRMSELRANEVAILGAAALLKMKE